MSGIDRSVEIETVQLGDSLSHYEALCSASREANRTRAEGIVIVAADLTVIPEDDVISAVFVSGVVSSYK